MALSFSEELEILTKFGDFLDGIDDVQELNDAGFNKIDKDRWPIGRGHVGVMKMILAKYKGQLIRTFGIESFRVIDWTMTTSKVPYIAPERKGDRVYMPLFGPRLAGGDFSSYLDVTRRYKNEGLRFDGELKQWYAPLCFDPTLMAADLKDEAKIEMLAWPEVLESERVSAREVINITNTVATADVLPDGRFIIKHPFSERMNKAYWDAEAFSGIVKWDRELKGRLVGAGELEDLRDAIALIGKIHPEWEFIDRTADAVAKVENIRLELRTPYKKVLDVLRKDLPKDLMLLPHQYEGVRLLDKLDGKALIGDDMGCISGDAVVTCNRFGKSFKVSLKNLYDRFNNKWEGETKIRCYLDGELRSMPIAHVTYSGIKPTKILSLIDGKSIVLTHDHQILTPDGWVEVENLLAGGTVATNGIMVCDTCGSTEGLVTYKYAKFLGKCRKCVYSIYQKQRFNKKEILCKDGYIWVTSGVRNHPNAQKFKFGIPKHRLVVEADMNGISFEDLVDRLKMNNIKGLKFLDKHIHVHHKNGIRNDNRLSNLEPMTVSEHHSKHHRHVNTGRFTPKWTEVVSITDGPPTETFDVRVPYADSFVANGIVVHNCGKTLTVLAWAKANGKRLVVICPKNVRRQWHQEAEKFFGRGAFKGMELDASITPRVDLKQFSLVTLNYEILKKFSEAILRGGFDLMVLDESHRIASSKAQITTIVRDMAKSFKHRILMSGTPLKNKKSEIYTQSEVVAPGTFQSPGQVTMMATFDVKETIRSFFFRRTKKGELKNLPDKIRQVMELEAEGLPDWEDGMGIGDISRLKSALALAKVPHTCEFIKDILKNTESKVIVYSDSDDACEAIGNHFGSLAVVHTGATPHETRERIKEQFCNEDNPVRIFVATTGSAREGLNLTIADKEVFNDLPWAPYQIAQSEDRAYRIGQKNVVNVYWTVVKGNFFDARIAEILLGKMKLTSQIIDGKKLSKEDQEIFQRGISPQAIITAMKEVA